MVDEKASSTLLTFTFLLGNHLHSRCGFLRGGHLLGPFHAPPFADFLARAPAADAQLAIELAQRYAGVFNVLGHACPLPFARPRTPRDRRCGIR